ncbi:MAG TPA: hypothetical protein VF163_10465 [Micromonosporaceae bacterium]
MRIFLPAHRRDGRSDRMAQLAFIVDDLVFRLSPVERLMLRQTGKVPDWFIPGVEAEYQRGHRG